MKASKFFVQDLTTRTLKAYTIYNENGIFIHGDIKINNLLTDTELKTMGFISNGEKQWLLNSHDDFEKVNASLI